MGIYGFTEIQITYKEGVDPTKFIEELKANDELEVTFMSIDFMKIESQRVQNLHYRENIFMSIVNKHKDLFEEIFATCFIEEESNIYYNAGDEE